MSHAKHALVLRLTGSGDPLLVALAPDVATALSERLPELMRRGDFTTIEAANGSSIVVNFSQVQAAFVDSSPGLGHIFGSPDRRGDTVALSG